MGMAYVNSELFSGRYVASRPSYQGSGRRRYERLVERREAGAGAETWACASAYKRLRILDMFCS